MTPIGLFVESPIFSHGFCNLKMKLDFIYIFFKVSLICFINIILPYTSMMALKVIFVKNQIHQ